MIYSSIDVGTNNILLLVAEKGKKITPIERKSAVAALGKGVKNGMLLPNSITKAKTILNDFIKLSRKYTDRIVITGTSCSRTCKNIYEISDWLEKEHNLKYNIISGEREAYLNGLANIKAFSDISEFTLFDIGGGSTEFTKIEKGSIVYTKSIDLGIRYLINKWNFNFKNITKDAEELLNEIETSKNGKNILVGIGGTSTSLSMLAQDLQTYDFAKVHKSKISDADLRKIKHFLQTADDDVITKKLQFEPERSELILVGTILVIKILEHFACDGFIVSDLGLRYGVLELSEEELKKYIK